MFQFAHTFLKNETKGALLCCKFVLENFEFVIISIQWYIVDPFN